MGLGRYIFSHQIFLKYTHLVTEFLNGVFLVPFVRIHYFSPQVFNNRFKKFLNNFFFIIIFHNLNVIIIKNKKIFRAPFEPNMKTNMETLKTKKVYFENTLTKHTYFPKLTN